jgi:hypothetical protein
MFGPLDQEVPSTLMVSKLDGNVVFKIINGERSHAVYQSNRPQALYEQAGHQIPGAEYRDSLTSDSTIVFYKID